jgi:MFS family permease
MWLRRRLAETRAFAVAAAEQRIQPSLWPRVPPAHRPDLWRVTAFVSATGLVQTPFFLFGSDLAQDVYDWDAAFTAIVMASGLATLAGFYLGGRASDVLGRRVALGGGLLLVAVGTLLVFTELRMLFVPGWFLGVGAYACLQAVVLAYVAELFPTELRATLSAFVVTASIVSGSIGLALVAGLGEVTGRSAVLVVLALLLLPVLTLLRRLPETAGRDVITLR